MGIRGLRSFLSKRVDIPLLHIQSGSTLVVDGDGWMFYLLKKCNHLRADLGGSYSGFVSTIVEEIRLLQSCGLILLVLFDGANNPLKEQTSAERLQKREQDWQQLYNHCCGYSIGTPDNQFPMFPLCKVQLLSTLTSRGVKFQVCQCEADPEIALIVQYQNSSSPGATTHFAYALDSDYYAMKDCPYIEFGAIRIDSAGLATAPVWTRSMCQQLSLSEDLFVEFLLFIGNDYTGPLIAYTDLYSTLYRECHNNPRLVMDRWLSGVQRSGQTGSGVLFARELFRPLVDHCQPTDKLKRDVFVGNLQFMFDYSRAVYNLQPLEGFHQHVAETATPSVPYTSAHCVFDFHLYSDTSEGKFFSDVPLYVRKAAKIGTVGVERGVAVHALTYLKHKKSEGQCVTSEHVEAIKSMLQQLSRAYGLQATLLDVEVPARAVWADAQAAFVFQRTCAVLLKAFPAGAFTGEHNTPARLFDGVLFHTALQNIHKVKAASYDELRSDASQPFIAVSPCPPTPAQCAVPFGGTSINVHLTTASSTSVDSANPQSTAQLSAPPITVHRESVDADTVEVPAVACPVPILTKESVYTPALSAPPTKKEKIDAKMAAIVERAKDPQKKLLVVPGSTETDPTLWHSLPTAPKAVVDFARVDAVDVTPVGPPTAGTFIPAALAPKLEPPTVAPPRYVAPHSRAAKAPNKSTSNANETLPIDAYREEILRRIQRNRVTVIHGETGCGKSSRLPQFLLEAAQASGQDCRIFVSQPRRIAVVGMLRRLRPSLGFTVGMRMGHGVRDETSETKLFYVTTGYLVKLMAHRSEGLHHCTHIIIDEVHERSVDGDLVCLLARDLLLTYPHLRVVLMSATINTDLYRDYFAQSDDGSFGPMDCLSVGVKRFPVEVKFLESLLYCDSSSVSRCAQALVQFDIMTLKWVQAQYNMVIALLTNRTVCKPGSAVLVFISGMDDISAIATLLEPHTHLLVCPLHSLIPEEEQDLAFEPTPAGRIKVVLATNAAESSVTIPDCDVVICLGTHKTMTYNETLRRTQLTFCEISKASATQRAGRTGRVRPGTAYRLYTEDTYAHMPSHELAEVLRRPLEDVILNTWIMLEDAADFEGVTPFLKRMIEAPVMTNLTRSYESLFDAGLITSSSDEGSLTPTGRFAGSLPVDLSLGRMLAHGVLLGVTAETVMIAAAMSLSRSPYRIANPIFHDPEEYNTLIRLRLLSETKYDQGVYSEPIALLRLLQAWRALRWDRERYAFCNENGLQIALMKQFNSSAESLAQELSHRLHRSSSAPPKAISLDSVGTLTESTISSLRLIMVWACSDNVLRLHKPPKTMKKLKVSNGSITMSSTEVTQHQMKALFGSVPHELKIANPARIHSVYFHITSTEQEPYRRLLTLVDTMARVAKLEPTQCFSIVILTADPNQSQIIFVALPIEGEESVADVFYDEVLDPSHVIDPTTAPLRRELTQDCPHLFGAEVFTCFDATRREVERLGEMLAKMKCALEMTIPLRGEPCLKSMGSALDFNSLSIIFGVDPSAGKKVKRRLVMNLIEEPTAVLTFPPEASACASLIQDLPFGHRLVQCCRTMKNTSLVLKRRASAADAPSTAEIEVDDGPYKAKRPEPCAKLEVAVNAISPVWGHCGDSGPLIAKLPRQGMLSCSLHCGPEELFAVAHSAVPITKLGDTFLVCRGVSFLPPGNTWLQLAMRCTGKDHLLPSTTTGEIPRHLLDLAQEIHYAVQDVVDFERRDDVIEQVQTLTVGIAAFDSSIAARTRSQPSVRVSSATEPARVVVRYSTREDECDATWGEENTHTSAALFDAEEYVTRRGSAGGARSESDEEGDVDSEWDQDSGGERSDGVEEREEEGDNEKRSDRSGGDRERKECVFNDKLKYSLRGPVVHAIESAGVAVDAVLPLKSRQLIQGSGRAVDSTALSKKKVVALAEAGKGLTTGSELKNEQNITSKQINDLVKQFREVSSSIVTKRGRASKLPGNLARIRKAQQLAKEVQTMNALFRAQQDPLSSALQSSQQLHKETRISTSVRIDTEVESVSKESEYEGDSSVRLKADGTPAAKYIADNTDYVSTAGSVSGSAEGDSGSSSIGEDSAVGEEEEDWPEVIDAVVTDTDTATGVAAEAVWLSDAPETPVEVVKSQKEAAKDEFIAQAKAQLEAKNARKAALKAEADARRTLADERKAAVRGQEDSRRARLLAVQNGSTSSTAGAAKVVSLPPSTPTPLFSKTLTKQEHGLNSTHGYAQAISYRDAHWARKADINKKA